MSLTTPLSVQKLQTALHDKAKESPDRRFHALYDKVYRRDVLAFAYQCCKANGGAAGGGRQRFGNTEEDGGGGWVGEMAQELKRRMDRAQPVRGVVITQTDVKQRPLGVATVPGRTARR